jgi:hypothetical protein
MRLYVTSPADDPLTTEYEQLLGRILEEKKVELDKLRLENADKKKVNDILSDIRYVELEIEHYQNGLKIFRSKSVPKVGRWGKPETEEHAATASS